MINSLIQNTLLKSHFIYDGKQDELTKWLKSKGVKVIFHQSSLKNWLLNPRNKRGGYNAMTACGAYLKLDSAIIAKELGYTGIILYTDCDILFNEGFNIKDSDLQNIKYFSVAKEFCYSETNRLFNTGVIFIDIDAFAQEYEAMLKYAKNPKIFPLLQDYDQGLLNIFYYNRFSELNPKFNHRPYYGINKDAQIVHFHGLKITNVEYVLKNGFSPEPIYDTLYRKNPAAYKYYYSLFKSYEKN